jgi:hypothetical protein
LNDPAGWYTSVCVTGTARHRVGPNSPAYAPFVIADLAEEIGEGSEPSVVLSEHALEGLLFEGGILRHELHIFVLSVSFEVGIQEIAPLGPDHIERPGDIVIQETNHLRDEPVLGKVFADSFLVLEFG